MTEKELKKQLKRLHQLIPEPSQERMDFLRVRLISRIKFEQFNQEPQNFYYLTFQDFLRGLLHPWRIAQSFGAVALSLVVIAVLSIGVVSANFAKPGSAFYGVKITMERMPLALPASIMSDQAKAEKEMTLAQNRQKEIETAVRSQSNNKTKSKKIKAAVVELSRNIESAKARVEQISQNNTDEKIVIAAANSFKDSVGEIKKSLDAVAQKIKDADIDSNTSDNIKDAMQKASQAELSTLGVLIAAVDKNAEASVEEKVQTEADKINVEEEADDVSQINNVNLENINAEKEQSAAETKESLESNQNESKISEPEIINNNPEITTEAGEVKDQVIKDLEKAIAELEKVLGPDKPAEGGEIAADENQNINQESIKSEEDEALGADKEAEEAESVIQKQNENNSEVVLNVAEVIEKEMLARKAAEQKALLQELIQEARQSLEAEDLPGALKNIEEARKILEN